MEITPEQISASKVPPVYFHRFVVTQVKADAADITAAEQEEFEKQLRSLSPKSRRALTSSDVPGNWKTKRRGCDDGRRNRINEAGACSTPINL